jgi:hypothetical protein
LAELIRADNPTFLVEKKSCSSENWSGYVNSISDKNRFVWAESPLVYRELADTGGRADLIGNYSDFAEYANLYYGKKLELSTNQVKKVTEENFNYEKKLETIKQEKIKDEKPLKIAIFDGGSENAYQFCNFLIAEDLNLKSKMAISLIGKDSDGLAMELFDTADEKLKACSFGDEIGSKESIEIAVIFDQAADNSNQGILA